MKINLPEKLEDIQRTLRFKMFGTPFTSTKDGVTVRGFAIEKTQEILITDIEDDANGKT